MIRFLHTADIHLDSPLKGLETHEDAPVEEIRGAARRAFDNLIDLAIEAEVDFVLIAGDLYDGEWRDYNTGLFFVSRMGKLAKAGVGVFIISGNHDAASQITKAMPLPSNVTRLASAKPQSITLEELGVIIHGQSYPSRAVTKNLASAFPPHQPGYFNIGLLHTSLTGRENHENYAPCSLDDLTSRGYEYWALGHVHNREVVSQDPWIIFPGNIQGRHIKESGSKGATIVTVEDNHVIDVEERNLDVLRWIRCRVDLSECESSDSIYDAVRSAFEVNAAKADGRTLIIRMILTGTCTHHNRLLERTTRWTEEFRGIAASLGDIWLEKVEFKTLRKQNLEELIDDQTPVAGLIKSIQNLTVDRNSILALVPELAALKTKLPAEIYRDQEPSWETSPGNDLELKAEIQEMLISKLLYHAGEK